MAKTPTQIASLARAHTETAINVLAGIMNQVEAPHAARVTAAQALLDRGWGKPTQTIAGDPDAPLFSIDGLRELLGAKLDRIAEPRTAPEAQNLIN